jgi:hypothetical protein
VDIHRVRPPGQGPAVQLMDASTENDAVFALVAFLAPDVGLRPDMEEDTITAARRQVISSSGSHSHCSSSDSVPVEEEAMGAAALKTSVLSERRISGWVSSRGQEDGAGEALAVHASSTLFCPHCHALTPQVDALAKQLTGNVLTPTRTEHMLWGLSDLCFSTIPEGAR